MPIPVNDNFRNNSPKSLDNKYLKNGLVAYSSVADANATILQAYRSPSLQVCIDLGGGIIGHFEYKDGTADTNLVLSSNPVIRTNSATDMTAAINAVFSNPLVTVLEIASPVTVNGTINTPEGKTLKFHKGGLLNGTGSLSNVVIDAGYNQKIFSETLGLSNFKTAGEYFSVEWFGASPNASGSVNAIAIQKAIDTLIQSGGVNANLFFPNSYTLDREIIGYKLQSGEYAAWSVNFIGNAAATNFTGSHLYFTNKTTFGLGIQNGKGCRVENLNIIGSWAVPNLTTRQFYECEWEDYNDPTCRDSRYSPYSGVVIDPFRRSSTLPPDGGYPSLSSWYQGSGGNGGSTGIDFINVGVSNFAVGFCISPNGSTLNAELLNFRKIHLRNLKSGFATCQDQEKVNVIDNVQAWENVHTLFVQNKYGYGLPAHWSLNNINIAGNVNRFIYHPSSDYYPIEIRGIYTETLGRFGTLNTTLGSFVDGGVIDFATPGQGQIISPKWHFDCSGVKFSNLTIRLYGTFYPVTISKGNIFDHCSFEVPPYGGDYFGSGNRGVNRYINCLAGNLPFGNQGPLVEDTSNRRLAYGEFAIVQETNSRFGKFLRANIKNDFPHIITYLSSAKSITVVDGAYTFDAGAEVYKFDIGEAVSVNDGADNVYFGGVVTSIVGNSVTVSYAPSVVNSGSWVIGGVHVIWANPSFLADYNYSATVTNVRYGLNSQVKVGTWVKTNTPNSDPYQDWSKIIAVDDGAKTITFATSMYGQGSFYFNNHGVIELDLNFNQPASGVGPVVMPKGSIIRNKVDNSLWIATSDGVLNGVVDSDNRTPNFIKFIDGNILVESALMLNNADKLIIPNWTDGAPVVTHSAGSIRYNDTIEAFEGYNGSDWVNLSYLQKTIIDYTPALQGTAYTGATDGEAKLADLNALRVAYENLRIDYEALRQALILTGIIKMI